MYSGTIQVKVIGEADFKGVRVEMKSGEIRTYLRRGPNSWYVLWDGSFEPISISCKALEEAYQEYRGYVRGQELWEVLFNDMG